MNFQKQFPSASLASLVRHYWYFEIGEDELPFSQWSFPYGAFELICYLENPNTMRWLDGGDDFVEPAIFYAGQLTRPFIMTFKKKCTCVGASLCPWAGELLYGIPARQFTDELTPLDMIENDDGFYDRLKMCRGKDALFDCMERYLIERLIKKQQDPMVYAIAKQIINDPTRRALNLGIGTIGLSRRRIEQRFINSTGLSMGAFTRKIRFQRAVHLLKEAQSYLSLTAIGLQAGYYDQAHFISDFKSFSGLSPGNFQARATRLNDFLKTVMPVN